MTMNKKAEIEREILKTLEVFERPDKLPPDPHFYGRVVARLGEHGGSRRTFLAVLRPALVTVLVVLNISTAVWYIGGRGRKAAAQRELTLSEVLAKDLNLENDQALPFVAERE
jgi:hypothetical protein